jgi:hypothetical protein
MSQPDAQAIAKEIVKGYWLQHDVGDDEAAMIEPQDRWLIDAIAQALQRAREEQRERDAKLFDGKGLYGDSIAAQIRTSQP